MNLKKPKKLNEILRNGVVIIISVFCGVAIGRILGKGDSANPSVAIHYAESESIDINGNQSAVEVRMLLGQSGQTAL